MSLALINVGLSHLGDLAGSGLEGDAVICDRGRIAWIGSSDEVSAAEHETALDACGAATSATAAIRPAARVTFKE